MALGVAHARSRIGMLPQPSVSKGVLRAGPVVVTHTGRHWYYRNTAAWAGSAEDFIYIEAATTVDLRGVTMTMV